MNGLGKGLGSDKPKTLLLFNYNVIVEEDSSLIVGVRLDLSVIAIKVV